MTKVIEELKAENEQLIDELDALRMRYLSQVSLWKSNYKELIKKLQEPIDEEKLDKLALREYTPWAIGLDKDEYKLDEHVKLQIEAYKKGFHKAWEDKQ